MKIMHKLEGGDLLAVVTRADRAQVAALRILAEDILHGIHGLCEDLREEDTAPGEIITPPVENDSTQLAVPPKVKPPIKKKAGPSVVKAKGKTKAGKPQLAKAAEKTNWKPELVRIMAGKGEMSAEDVAIAYAADKGISVTHEMKRKIGVCLPSHSDVFERIGRGKYRVGKPVSDRRPDDVTRLLSADPKDLSDDELGCRLSIRKERCEEDKPARLEFLVRKQAGA